MRNTEPDTLRVLSVMQPWASLIASGQKRVEVRCWPTPYRGQVLIVSGGRPWRGPRPEGVENGPLGCALCLVDLVDCVPLTPELRRAGLLPDDIELDPTKSWFAWVLESPRKVKQRSLKCNLGLVRPKPEHVELAASAV